MNTLEDLHRMKEKTKTPKIMREKIREHRKEIRRLKKEILIHKLCLNMTESNGRPVWYAEESRTVFCHVKDYRQVILDILKVEGIEDVKVEELP